MRRGYRMWRGIKREGYYWSTMGGILLVKYAGVVGE
jgi:hypothetical protein